jgi:malonyl-CoA O-methyltransferase
MNNFYKNKIKHHFNKAYKTYDDYCVVQNDASQRALELLMQHPFHFKKIADFACGTGESTLRLIRQIKHEECYAIDFSDKLLHIAASKLPDAVNCILSDFDTPLFPNDSLDLIFCNMGLQWSLNLERTLSLFDLYLTKNGCFAFSMPVTENFPEMKAEFKSLPLSSDQIIHILNNTGFKLVAHYNYKNVQLFESYYHALKSLQKIGANFSPEFNNKGLRRVNVREIFVEDCLRPQLTYHIGIYLCQKQSL